jgi:Mrp family chromosome partitioning ATPase
MSTDRPFVTQTPPTALPREVRPVGRVRLRPDAPIVAQATPSYAAEQYRNLAVQVEERINPIGTWGYALTVASSEPGAGKTVTSLNLALTLTRGGDRRVLLVEGDLWRPRIESYLEPLDPHGPDTVRDGLLQVLERRLPLAQAVVEVAGTSLAILTAGARGISGDVISGRRMSEALAEMRGAYEIVVIDSPPMALLASARSLAARSDGVVLVVRARQSRKKAIESALAALGPEKLVGLVLNDARVPRRGYQSYS